VGGALTARLLRDAQRASGAEREADEVRVLARDAAAAARAPDGTRACVASLGDPNAIAEAARGVDVLYHCAGENDSRASQKALAWVNVAGTENVINAARHAGVRRVVHLSCADATLIDGNRMSWKETSSLTQRPLDACARAKLLAEELALQASRPGFEVCALRPAWIWGAGDRRTLPALYEEAQRGRVQLCGDGKNLVPTAHVDNVVDALLLAARAERAPSRAYHIVDAETLDASELLGKLCQVLGVAPPARGVYALAYAAAWLRAQLGKPGLWPADVARRGRSCLFDATAAARDLSYEPKTSVDAGMQRLSDWLQHLGGPAALAAQRRRPAGDADIAALEQIAHAAEHADATPGMLSSR
jgi:nucleoside-diphosphate-sugar epimerase